MNKKNCGSVVVEAVYVSGHLKPERDWMRKLEEIQVEANFLII